MITLTRLSGSKFVLNSDLIERIDVTPDTVVTLADGTKYVVADSMEDVVAEVRRFRSEILTLAWQLDAGAPPTSAPVRLAPVTAIPATETDADPDEEEL